MPGSVAIVSKLQWVRGERYSAAVDAPLVAMRRAWTWRIFYEPGHVDSVPGMALLWGNSAASKVSTTAANTEDAKRIAEILQLAFDEAGK